MFNTLKDYLTAIFYLCSVTALLVFAFLAGALVIIPLLMYVTYKIIRIRGQIRKLQEQETNDKVHYTIESDRDRTGTHED